MPPIRGWCGFPACTYQMGSEKLYPEERPVHRVSAGEASGSIVFGDERVTPDSSKPPDTSRSQRFRPKRHSIRARCPRCCSLARSSSSSPVVRSIAGTCATWWHFVKGADWRHPHEPESFRSTGSSSTRSCASHAATPKRSRCGTASRCRPRRSGSSPPAADCEGAAYAWGDTFLPGDQHMANTWQGEFPWREHSTATGMRGTSPVGAFPANGYGLHDMIGNVLGVDDRLVNAASIERSGSKACCTPHNPRGPQETRQLRFRGSRRSGSHSKVIKGGSHLCARTTAAGTARPAARFPWNRIDTSHVPPWLPLYRASGEAGSRVSSRA